MPSSLLSKKQGRRSTISVPGVEIVGPRTPYLGGGPTGHKLKARYDIACPGANGPLRGPGRSPRPRRCVHHGPRHAGDKGDGLGTGRDVLGVWPAVTPRSAAVSTAHQQRLAAPEDSVALQGGPSRGPGGWTTRGAWSIDFSRTDRENPGAVGRAAFAVRWACWLTRPHFFATLVSVPRI